VPRHDPKTKIGLVNAFGFGFGTLKGSSRNNSSVLLGNEIKGMLLVPSPYT